MALRKVWPIMGSEEPTNATVSRLPTTSAPTSGVSAWALGGEGEEEWDRDAYIIASTNDHDHSTVYSLPRQFRVPQSLLNQIMFHVGDERTAYRSKADFLRDAIVHRLAYLAEREDHLADFRRANNFIALTDSIAADVALEEEMEATLNDISARAKRLVLDGRADDLVSLFERAKHAQVETTHQASWLNQLADLEDEVESFSKRRNRD